MYLRLIFSWLRLTKALKQSKTLRSIILLLLQFVNWKYHLNYIENFFKNQIKMYLKSIDSWLRLIKALKQSKAPISTILLLLQFVNWKYHLNYIEHFFKNKIKMHSRLIVSWLRLTRALTQLKALISTI